MLKPEPGRIRREIADEVTGVLKQISKGHALDNGARQTAGKTGTWENGNDKNENAHAWFVGYTEQLAAAVWVGNTAEHVALQHFDLNESLGPAIPIPSPCSRAYISASVRLAAQSLTPYPPDKAMNSDLSIYAHKKGRLPHLGDRSAVQ